MHKICFDCFHPLKSFFCLSIDVSFVLMGLFYVYEVIVVNGLGIEVCGVLGFVIFVFSDPKAGNDHSPSRRAGSAHPGVPDNKGCGLCSTTACRLHRGNAEILL